MARQSALSLSLQLFGIACGFLFAVIVARWLGPRGYGLVAVALSVANTAATLALLGANGLAVREISASEATSDWVRLRAFLRWAFTTVPIAAAGIAIVVAVGSFAAGPYQSVLLIGSMAIPLLAGLQLLRGINQGSHRIVQSQVPLDVVRWVVLLSFLGLLFGMHTAMSAPGIVAIVLAAFTASLIVAAVGILRHLRTLPGGKAESAGNRHWFSASAPFLVVALLGIAATEMNTLLLGALAGPNDAGLYQPIARLAPLMPIIKEAIEMPLAPRISALWANGDREELSRTIQRAALTSAFGGALVAIAIVLAAPLIFAAFGKEFETVRPYVYWIAAAHVINAAFGPSALLLSMAGDMRRRIRAQAYTLIAQTLFTSALVPALGVKGAAIALALQIMSWAVINWFMAKRSTGIDTSVLALLSVRK